MKTIKLVSWNVNGLRAVAKKGFLDWIASEKPDILGIQETKSNQDQLAEEVKKIPGYRSYFVSAEKKGYSGTAFYTKLKPDKIKNGLGIKKFDSEGRVIKAHYEKFLFYNIYFPNGKASNTRLRYKMDFYDTFLTVVKKQLKQGKKIIICGDVNTAHREIDLARPKENSKVSGFLPEERAWIDKFLATGFLDTFRVFNKKADQYSWWSYRTQARKRNVGWRLDYFFVSKNLKKNLVDAYILPKVMGSDHCPVGLEIII